MDVIASTPAACPPERAFAEISVLDGYPSWSGIVQSAAPAAPMAEDEGPAWFVDLGAVLGPIRRGKRLRMVRTVFQAPEQVRFERRETDGRPHGTWVLGGSVSPRPGGGMVDVTMTLHYSGSGWLPVLDRVLAGEVRRAGLRLAAFLGGGGKHPAVS